MALDAIAGLFLERAPIPNKFTIARGELIRKTREVACLSPIDLAERIYRRQTIISEMKNGKIELRSGILALLAIAIEKPITYFNLAISLWRTWARRIRATN